MARPCSALEVSGGADNVLGGWRGAISPRNVAALAALQRLVSVRGPAQHPAGHPLRHIFVKRGILMSYGFLTYAQHHANQPLLMTHGILLLRPEPLRG